MKTIFKLSVIVLCLLGVAFIVNASTNKETSIAKEICKAVVTIKVSIGQAYDAIQKKSNG